MKNCIENEGFDFWQSSRRYKSVSDVCAEGNRMKKRVNKLTVGILCRWESAWIGVHYSPYNRRFCINLIPFVTFWITLKGGLTP